MKIFGPGKGMGIQSCNWLSIAVRVKTKTAEQCFKKWESTLPVQCGARRFNWRADECKRLLQVILLYGNTWERNRKPDALYLALPKLKTSNGLSP